MAYEKIDMFQPGNFIGRVSLIHEALPPLRAYMHRTGLDAYPTMTEAIGQLRSAVFSNLDIANGDFLLTILWGKAETPMIDLFSYAGMAGWPGNPDVSAYVLENGVYMPEARQITCGDGLIVLGKEEEHRRATKSLEEYIRNAPRSE